MRKEPFLSVGSEQSDRIFSAVVMDRDIRVFKETVQILLFVSAYTVFRIAMDFFNPKMLL